MTPGRLLRIRWGVRAALGLGVAASVTANILHAHPNPISQTIAAWPPIALLVDVELISRVPVHHRTLTAVRLAATGFIAAIAAWVSYTHMAGVAVQYGEHGAAPYLIPLSVDGLVLVASVCLVELTGRNPDIAPQPTPDIPTDTTPDITRTRTPQKRDTATAVARLRAEHPDLGTAEIARRLGVTDRTVRRHLTTQTTTESEGETR